MDGKMRACEGGCPQRFTQVVEKYVCTDRKRMVYTVTILDFMHIRPMQANDIQCIQFSKFSSAYQPQFIVRIPLFFSYIKIWYAPA